MDVVFKYLSDIRVVIAIAAIAVLLIIVLIVQKLRGGKARKELEELEERYKKIKSVPLSFKLNKAVAISRVEPTAMAKVTQMKDDFDKAESNLKQIGQLLADTEDEIIAGKMKKAKMDLEDLEASISLGETQVATLDEFLDSILEKETAQRQEINELKNQYRDLKDEAARNRGQLNHAWATIEQLTSQTETMFSNFDEWMYGSEYEKANAELANIRANIERFRDLLKSMPELLEDARGVVPKMAEVVHHDYTEAREKGVYLKHLQVDQNLTLITGGLKNDLDNLKNGNAEGVREHLDDYKERLKQLGEQIHHESESFDQVKALANETTTLYNETERSMAYVTDQYKRLSTRFGLSGIDTRIASAKDSLRLCASKMPKVFTLYQENQNPSSGLIVTMKELNQDLTHVSDSLREIRAEIDSASGGEERAKKQLVKLQVIMNQMQVKIAKYKLPSISEQYNADMRKADTYISRLNELINEAPLNVQLLNNTLKEAIDFIYRLYNNVNNVVATVMMVENTIVFGNRYRSTYADIDSELTRSELCFRNGDYTQALSIAIATIEKIHPGNYESMIRENSNES